MHIAIIGDRGIPACYSGFSTLTEQMAVRMVQEYGLEVTVYCRKHYYSEHPKKYKGVNCVYLPAPGGKSFESIIHSNFSILHAATKNYDAIIVLDPGNGPFVLPLKFRSKPLLMHTDGMGWKRKKWSPMQQRYYKWSEKVTAFLSDWLVTDSRAMQDYYLESYGAPSSFIPYAGEVGDGVDMSILSQHDLTPGQYFICVARIEPDNNIDVIIREYRKADLDFPLVVVGGARYDTEYGRQIAAENDGKVRCIGAVYEKNKLNALLKSSYAYVHGHEVGGTNPSLLNAMHMGAAPVCFDVVFHRQVMSDSGMYFSKSPGALAMILRNLKPVDVARLRRLAKERSDKLYRWDAVVDAYVNCVTNLVCWQQQGRKNKDDLMDREFYNPEAFYNDADKHITARSVNENPASV